MPSTDATPTTDRATGGASKTTDTDSSEHGGGDAPTVEPRLVLDERLVEDVSIDGMCGVY